MTASYKDFLETKIPVADPCGFDIALKWLNSLLFQFQAKIVQWALKRGRAAIFADCGLGKSLMQLEWAAQVVKYTGGNVLIFAPLAVAKQTVEEGQKFGIEVHQCSSMADVKPGINITNYEKMHHFTLDFAGIVLDESSILKGFDGKYSTALKQFAESIPFRLACTATPAPNDMVELCNHAEFLGIMREKEIKALFFKQAVGNGTVHEWTLKPHSKTDFYRWLASWSIAIRKPSDIGFSDDGYILPDLNINQISVESDYKKDGMLFALEAQTLSDRRDARRASLDDRVKAAAELVNNSDEQWLVWCDLNAESEALAAAIPGSFEVKGSDKPEYKEQVLTDFAHGSARVLISKPTIAGFGMNFQKCHNMIFVGLSDSYEQIYQATRRCWRFGQERPVNVYVITSSQEGAVVRNIERKEQQMTQMFNELVEHMKDLQMDNATRMEMAYREHDESGRNWRLMLGDCIERVKDIESDSVGITIFSPPFPGMYAYSNSARDIGNTRNIEEMLQHFEFLMDELLRVSMPGRSCLVHLTQEPVFKGKDGHVGMRDFRGETIRRMEQHGWIYYGEVTIDKNPQIKAARTKESTLLFKTLSTDSSKVRMAMADYLLQFVKPGENPEPVTAGTHPRWNPNGGWITPEEWCRWARPVWYGSDWAPDGDGIGETDVLNVAAAREKDDERHLCLATGTLILTKDGYKPIESVEIGDLTLTHMGRWRRVIAKACTGVRPVIQVKAQGVPNLVITPDHKLWTRKASTDPCEARRSAKQSDPEWIRSDETKGSYINLKLPPIEETPSSHDEHEWKIIGRWLADGHIHTHNQNGKTSVYISCGSQKLESLKILLGDRLGGVNPTPTAFQIRVKDADGRLRKTISECGHGAKNKRLPGEAFTLPVNLAKALLDGYLSGDGHYVESRDKWMASSVSRELLLGLALLVQRVYGTVASVYAGREAGKCQIQGRTVNTSQDWVMCFNAKKDTSAFITDDGAWKKVRSTNAVEDVETWSLQVEEDESYTAEGCIVKNCPLQLGVIERAIKLWSNPGDLVLDPFNGIGSTGYKALQLHRKYVGIELKESYFKQAVKNLKSIDNSEQQDLLSLLEVV